MARESGEILGAWGTIGVQLVLGRCTIGRQWVDDGFSVGVQLVCFVEFFLTKMSNNYTSKILLLLFGLTLLSCDRDEQPENPSQTFPVIMEFPDVINENSGLLNFGEQKLLAHNDSGDSNRLFEIDLDTKTIARTIIIENAGHVDWESITADSEFVYVGDMGNNYGNRMNLIIYKIEKAALENGTSVTAESIFFHYEDQTEFNDSTNHNFDCEAMLAFPDQLILFTKNRKDQQTNIYSLPKSAGTHTAQLNNSFDVNGLITSASINPDRNILSLLGYQPEDNSSNYRPFIWLFYDFPGMDFLNGKNQRVDFDMSGQTEAHCFIDSEQLYFSTEDNLEGKSFLFAFEFAEWVK